ncbi:hypothetical protein SIID45300_00060 [Candidatus Magnetaquicoccaceae bacterium FCR-1]|uniref:Uncharacterized protein n=1 Tax=Candidatus Magnetaquiglobus chichijimensis TaxID=3141448 RepID=A0ABQ0C4E0_9PROT
MDQPPPPSDNRNWVTVSIPWLTATELAEFIDTNPRRLFGLNPTLRLDRWEADPNPLQPEWRAHLHAFNEANDQHTTCQITCSAIPDGWLLTYDSGWKRALEITRREHDDQGSALTLTEHYHPLPDQPPAQEARARAIDPSLIPWGRAVRRHLFWHARLGWIPVCRWYLAWLPGLKPSTRRIVRLLVWSGVLEWLVLTLMLGGMALTGL